MRHRPSGAPTYRSAFRRLQAAQSACRFASLSRPPNRTGVWSTCAAGAPHRWHVQPSRYMTLARVFRQDLVEPLRGLQRPQ